MFDILRYKYISHKQGLGNHDGYIIGEVILNYSDLNINDLTILINRCTSLLKPNVIRDNVIIYLRLCGFTDSIEISNADTQIQFLFPVASGLQPA